MSKHYEGPVCEECEEALATRCDETGEICEDCWSDFVAGAYEASKPQLFWWAMSKN